MRQNRGVTMTILPPFLSGFTVPDSRKRRLVLALGIYATCTAIFVTFAGRANAPPTTPPIQNHYALLADA